MNTMGPLPAVVVTAVKLMVPSTNTYTTLLDGLVKVGSQALAAQKLARTWTLSFMTYVFEPRLRSPFVPQLVATLLLLSG